MTKRDGTEDVHEWNGELDLYALEADAVAQYLDAKEAPYMTVKDTMGNMLTLDALRASANFRFDGEAAA
jgi:hypothetical protein